MSGGGGIAPAWRALALLAALAACRPEPYLPAPDVVARLGDTEIRAAAFETYLKVHFGEASAALGSEALSSLFDQFVRERLLLLLAEERGLVAPGGDPRRAVEALLAAAPDREPTVAEIGDYFRQHEAEFRRPERVQLRQILVEDRVEAERARRQLAAGEPFAEVARRVSRDARATAGGEQGELAKDDLPTAFADAIFALPDGGISQVFEADYGCLVFQVVAHLPEQTLTLTEAEPEIRRRLAGSRGDAALSRLVGEAESRYAVQVYDRNLPFAYRGALPTARPLEER